MPGALFLEGEKVELRTVEEEDLEFIRDQYNREEIRTYLTHEKPANLQQERQFFEDEVSAEGSLVLMISSEGTPVGLVSIERSDISDETGEIGIWLKPEEHGQGYGTEAAELLLDHAFRQLNYHRITAEVLRSNDASRKLWEKLGFEKEGEMREQCYREGEYEDVIVYGLLEQEWE